MTGSQRPATITLLILFQLSLLKGIGLQPVLSHCVNCETQYAICNTQHEFYFSSSANGLVCRDCEAAFPDKIRLSSNAAKCLNNLKIIADAGEKTLKEIEKILINHFTAILGRQPKMAKHILKL
jgi:recombinational DNA repair protein (RecF pathway)